MKFIYINDLLLNNEQISLLKRLYDNYEIAPVSGTDPELPTYNSSFIFTETEYYSAYRLFTL